MLATRVVRIVLNPDQPPSPTDMHKPAPISPAMFLHASGGLFDSLNPDLLVLAPGDSSRGLYRR